MRWVARDPRRFGRTGRAMGICRCRGRTGPDIEDSGSALEVPLPKRHEGHFFAPRVDLQGLTDVPFTEAAGPAAHSLDARWSESHLRDGECHAPWGESHLGDRECHARWGASRFKDSECHVRWGESRVEDGECHRRWSERRHESASSTPNLSCTEPTLQGERLSVRRSLVYLGAGWRSLPTLPGWGLIQMPTRLLHCLRSPTC
jgi:hypothetical protein